MPAVLITWPTDYCCAELHQISSLEVAKTVLLLIVPTHGGTAKLSRPDGLIKYQDGHPS